MLPEPNQLSKVEMAMIPTGNLELAQVDSVNHMMIRNNNMQVNTATRDLTFQEMMEDLNFRLRNT